MVVAFSILCILFPVHDFFVICVLPWQLLILLHAWELWHRWHFRCWFCVLKHIASTKETIYTVQTKTDAFLLGLDSFDATCSPIAESSSSRQEVENERICLRDSLLFFCMAVQQSSHEETENRAPLSGFLRFQKTSRFRSNRENNPNAYRSLGAITSSIFSTILHSCVAS